MKRDYEAKEVTIGSVWYIWGEHREVVERFNMQSHEVGAPTMIPIVRLCPLKADGTRKKVRNFPIPAWRVAYYGQPSVAFSKASA